MGKITESTWSPFQSPEVREICAHLTPEEKGKLINLATKWGLKGGLWTGIPVALISVAFSSGGSVPAGLILSGLYILFLLTFGRRQIRAHQRRVRAMLCSTEYAKSRGYQPETLRMFALPWSG